MMNFNCPVCNKAGLPDYKIYQTVCPQCNSDLKPYMLISSIKKIDKSTTALKIFSGVLTLAICILLVLYLKKSTDTVKTKNNYEFKIAELTDSLRNTTSNIHDTTAAFKSNTTAVISIVYNVKNDDCLSKIAEFFYNDWKEYKRIESDNNLQEPYVLKVGQPLIIKLNQQ